MCISDKADMPKRRTNMTKSINRMHKIQGRDTDIKERKKILHTGNEYIEKCFHGEKIIGNTEYKKTHK